MHVLYGASDWLAGPAVHVATAFEPDAPLEIIPLAGHFPWMEARESTFTAVMQFITAAEY